MPSSFIISLIFIIYYIYIIYHKIRLYKIYIIRLMQQLHCKADFRYRHRLLFVPKYMHIQFIVLLQNKEKESLDTIKVLILLPLLLGFMWLQALARVWHFW